MYRTKLESIPNISRSNTFRNFLRYRTITKTFSFQNTLSHSEESANLGIDDYLDDILNLKNVNSHQKKLPKSLQDFMDSEEFSRTVTTRVDKTVGEIFLMILQYSVHNHQSVTAMTNLFKLMNAVFSEPILPDSRYAMYVLLNSKSDNNFHAVCHNCSAYVGIFEEVVSVEKCSNCNMDLDLSNPSNASYFVIHEEATRRRSCKGHLRRQHVP